MLQRNNEFRSSNCSTCNSAQGWILVTDLNTQVPFKISNGIENSICCRAEADSVTLKSFFFLRNGTFDRLPCGFYYVGGAVLRRTSRLFYRGKSLAVISI
jgi:hypothetical protein